MAFPSVVCRIAFATAPFATTPTWTDVSTDLMSISIRRGRQHELDRMEAGTATIVLSNVSGDYWPNNAGGSYYPNVLPGKRVNLRVTWDGNTYDEYTGFVEGWTPSFVLQPIQVPVMVVQLADLKKNLARLLLNDGTGESAELSGARIGNVLDTLGWPSGDRDIDAGQSTMMATGAIENVNALDHLFNVQLSELGIMFIAGDGHVQFQDRHARLKSPYIVSQATFGDDAGEMGYYAITLAYDDQYIFNDVRITRSGGTEQVAADSTSQTAYGKRSLARSGLLMTTDNEALDQANYLLGRFKDPSLRVKSITIRPGADPDNLYPKVLGYDISTRITIRLNQASIDGDYHIEGISHDWSALHPELWTTTWELSNADTETYWTLGETGFSELDTKTRLAY